MRVGLVICGDLDLLTGGFLYDRFLVQALRRRGHRVEVVALPWRSYARRLGHNFSTGLRARLAGTAWDILVEDALTHPSLFHLNTRLKAETRVPLAGIVHQVLSGQPRSTWVNRAYRAVEARYLDTLDAFIFNSTDTRARALDTTAKGRPECVVRPAGNRLGSLPSADTIVERSRRDGPLELLFVGNITPVKGLAELLSALAGVTRSAWQLTVVGDLGFDRRCVRRAQGMVAAHGLEEQVFFTGPLDGDALRGAYARHHVLAMPFALEGFGMAALEAMGHGLPVIGSIRGGVGEFVRHGDNGFLVAPGDAEALRRYIAGLHGDRARLAAMGRSALNTFKAWPTWEETMAPACAFLEGIAR
jgi:glycosyltransferase involved in cell wall biosynthesis